MTSQAQRKTKSKTLPADPLAALGIDPGPGEELGGLGGFLTAEAEKGRAAAADAVAKAAIDAASAPEPGKRSAAEPLVDLDDIVPDRPTVRFHGTLYELARLDDFGIATQQALTRDGREFSTLWSAEDELSEHEGARLKMLLERMFEQVFKGPKTVKRQFDDAQKSRVVLAFTIAPLAQAAARQAQMEAEAEARESASTTAS